MIVFERFTDRARQAVVLAQEEARILNHDYIGTEHILLGLVHEGDGVAARALLALDISLESIREQVEAVIGRGQAGRGGGADHIPFTPRAKKVLELSLREALQFGHNYIGTEHILLGLLREGDGVGAQVLGRLGADLNGVRQAVMALLGGEAAPIARRRWPFGRRERPEMAQFEGQPEDEPEVGLERLTDDALQAVVSARDEVRQLGLAEIEPEHLLAGLLAGPADATAQRLTAAGVTLEALRAELEAVAERPDHPLPAVPPLTWTTWRALEQADERAGVEGTIDTAGVLAALIETSSAVRFALRAVGADYAALRDD